MEDSISELADSIYREKVLRARAAPVIRKMGWGAELFRESLGRMRSGVRAQFPAASEDEVREILRKRLARLTQVHEHGIYHPHPDSK